MTTWIIPCNEKYYKHREAFEALDTIDWRQSTNVEVGDEVYIYVGQSVGAILYKCKAIDIDIVNPNEIDRDYIIDNQLSLSGRYMRLKLIEKYADDKFKRKELMDNGLKTVQGPTKATSELIAYLEK